MNGRSVNGNLVHIDVRSIELRINADNHAVRCSFMNGTQFSILSTHRRYYHRYGYGLSRGKIRRKGKRTPVTINVRNKMKTPRGVFLIKMLVEFLA